jgi:hypothetical protein
MAPFVQSNGDLCQTLSLQIVIPTTLRYRPAGSSSASKPCNCRHGQSAWLDHLGHSKFRWFFLCVDSVPQGSGPKAFYHLLVPSRINITSHTQHPALTLMFDVLGCPSGCLSLGAWSWHRTVYSYVNTRGPSIHHRSHHLST